MKLQMFAAALLVGSFAVPALVRAGEAVVWTDYTGHNVQVRDPNGAVRTLASGSDRLSGVVYDQASGWVYWSDLDGDTISRVQIDGSNSGTFLTITPPPGTQSTLEGLAVDDAAGKLYFEDSTDYGHQSFIETVDFSGNNLQTIITQSAADTPASIALDLVHGKMYWTDFAVNQVWESNLDGGNPQAILSNFYASGVAVDPASGTLYLSHRTGLSNNYSYSIVTTDLNGGNLQTLIAAGLNDPREIALDVADGVGYEADLGSGSIVEFNLDGSGVFPLVSGLSDPIGISAGVVPEPASLGLLAVGLGMVALRRKRYPAQRIPLETA